MASNRLDHIDAIRGLAALAVLYFHVAEFAHKRDLVSSPVESAIFVVTTEWLDLGKIAVAVFFAVSGYVIPFSLMKPQDRPLTGFAISRFFRLYPAYWVSIALALVFLYDPGHGPTPLQVLANVTMMQQFVGQANIIGLYWTLQIELIFYVLCAALFHAGLLGRPRVAMLSAVFFMVVALGFAAVRYALERKVPVALPLSLGIMFWGLSWRYALTSTDAALRRSVGRLTVLLLLLILPICVLAYNKDYGFQETWYRYAITYYFAFGLFMLLTTRVKLNHRALAWLGMISYSVYLLGPIAQEIVQKAIGVDNLASVPIHLVILLAGLLTIAASYVNWRLVEAPAQAFGRRLVRGRRLASSAP